MEQLPPESCSCLAKSHDHEPNKCGRRGKTRGGVCADCNYWSWKRMEKSNGN